MKEVTMTRIQYDECVYPAVALQPVGDAIADLRMCVAILEKLEKEGAKGKPLDRSLWPPGADRAPPALYKLNGLSASFEFENEEAAFIVSKLTDLLPQTQGRIMRPALDVINALEREPEKDD